MRYLILSDIHANWQALEAVLADAAGRCDTILCCGDLVGYGGDPDLVTDWVRQNVRHVVRGNHDKAVAGSDALEWFNPEAKAATLWTREALSGVNMSYLAQLPRGPLEFGGFQLVHGTPFDEDDYIVNESDATRFFGYLQEPLTFFGHSHLQGGFRLRRRETRRIEPVGLDQEQEELPLAEEYCYLINPGSVGQPRDADPRAGYAIYDAERAVVVYRRVAYDVAAAQLRIMQAGLPPHLARRLAVGS